MLTIVTTHHITILFTIHCIYILYTWIYINHINRNTKAEKLSNIMARRGGVEVGYYETGQLSLH